MRGRLVLYIPCTPVAKNTSDVPDGIAMKRPFVRGMVTNEFIISSVKARERSVTDNKMIKNRCFELTWNNKWYVKVNS